MTEVAGAPAPTFVIGIPTVRRATDYLLSTLNSLWRQTSAQEKEHYRIVVFNAEMPANRHAEALAIPRIFSTAVQSGMVEVISRAVPHPELAELDSQRTTLGDSMARYRWRAKQVLDAAYLMEQCAGRARYYLHLEDDVIAAPNCIHRLMTWMSRRPLLGASFTRRNDWLMLAVAPPFRVRWDAAKVPPKRYGGFVGHVLQSADLPPLADALRSTFDEQPLDWLVGAYAAQQQRPIFAARRALFQHVGDVSSLAGKYSRIRVPGFRD
jgi:hypothetical protein